MNQYRKNPLIRMQFYAIALFILSVAALAGAKTPATASANNSRGAADADTITPPIVPTDIQVSGEVFLVGHATGTQNYVCLPSSSGVAYSLFTPQATLFNDQGEQIITHFFSANPFEIDTDPTVFGDHPIRATWQHSRDTSTVWAKVTGSATDITDPQFVAKGAIAWLRLQVKDVGALSGPTGGDKLTKTTFIQRINTVGGVAPSTGCSALTDIGNKAFVHYTADYVFYKDAGGNQHDDN